MVPLFMVEIDKPEAVQAYRQYLDAYASEQQQLGRFQWKPNNRLRDVPEFLDYQHVVPSNTRLSLLVALGLLVVCLVNTVALLLAKFLGRSGEIAVRRALGASRSALYAQFPLEAAVIDAPEGGLLGLLFTAIGVLEVGVVMPGPSRRAGANRPYVADAHAPACRDCHLACSDLSYISGVACTACFAAQNPVRIAP